MAKTPKKAKAKKLPFKGGKSINVKKGRDAANRKKTRKEIRDAAFRSGNL